MRMLLPGAGPATGDELDDEALAAVYAYPDDRPWLRLNFVSSVDGAVQGPDGRAGTLSSKADQRLFALLRSLSDAILVGAGTVRVEGYRPVQPTEVDTALRARLGLTGLPRIAVVSRRLDLPPDLVGDSAAGTVVVTCAAAPADRLAELRESCDVVVAGDDRVDFGAARDALVDRGITRLLSEGGPVVARDLAAADALDEVCLTLSPLLLAGGARRVTMGERLDPPRELALASVLAGGDDVFLRYTRRS